MSKRAVDETTALFVKSLTEAVPAVRVNVQRSYNSAGRSNYVHINDEGLCRYWKVRVSDHPVGMRRAMSGKEALYVFAGASPSSWAVWLGDFVRRVSPTPSEG